MGTWGVVAKGTEEGGKGGFIGKSFYSRGRQNSENDPLPKFYALIPRTCKYNDIWLP